MEHLLGVRTLIDRLGLPPRMKQLVAAMEEQRGPLEEVGDTPGAAEVKRVLALVDGNTLLACMVAAMLNEIEVSDEELKEDKRVNDDRSDYERWLEAANAYPDKLVLLLIGDTYYAFDGQAERLADELEEHLFKVGRETGIAFKADHQPTWESKILDAGLDVLLVAEAEEGDDGGPGYSTVNLLGDDDTDPLDHDHNGKKGGSLPGDQSTAHKGAAKKKKAKPN